MPTLLTQASNNPLQSRQTIQTTNIMIDSGAATHACPLWFADNYPIHPLEPGQGPQLRTATNKPIYTHGVRWVYMKSQQPIVIPFYACDVHDPILSVTRLAEQGFDIRFNDAPTMRHNKGFDVKLVQENNLYYLPATIMAPGHNQHLQVQQATDGMVAMIAPTTLAKTGPQQVLGGNNDYWAYNNEGYLVRCHRNKRKALFVPQLNCPVPLEQLANYWRTIIRRQDGNNEDFTEQFLTMEKNKQKRVLQGQAWTGESWFRVNKTKETSPAQASTASAQTSKAPAQATTTIHKRQPEAIQQRQTQQQKRKREQPPVPHFRHTTKMPVPPQQSTAVPHPLAMSHNDDYWVREGHSGKESTSRQDKNYACHNKPMMDQMLQS